MYQDFRLVLCPESVSRRFELAAKFAVVIDLTIVGNDDTAIPLGERLCGGFDIEDA